MTLFCISLTDGDGDATDEYFTSQALWDWLWSNQPEFAEGEHGIAIREDNTPPEVWEVLKVLAGESDSVGRITSGSYDNDKAQLLSMALAETPEPPDVEKTRLLTTVDEVVRYTGLWY